MSKTRKPRVWLLQVDSTADLMFKASQSIKQQGWNVEQYMMFNDEGETALEARMYNKDKTKFFGIRVRGKLVDLQSSHKGSNGKFGHRRLKHENLAMEAALSILPKVLRNVGLIVEEIKDEKASS